MATRKEQLFAVGRGTKSPDGLSVSTSVQFIIDKKKKTMKDMPAEQKLVCALRKVLLAMSEATGGKQRFFLYGTEIKLMAPVEAQGGGKEGEPSTYHAKGRCKLGVALHTNESATKQIEFEISFKDVKDSLGLPDVVYFDPTSVEELPANTVL